MSQESNSANTSSFLFRTEEPEAETEVAGQEVTPQESTPTAEAIQNPTSDYNSTIITSKGVAVFETEDPSTATFLPIYSTAPVELFQDSKKKGFGKCRTSLRVLRSSTRVLHVKLDRCLRISDQLGSDLEKALDYIEEAKVNCSSDLGSLRLEAEMLKMDRELGPLEKTQGPEAASIFESQAAKDVRDCLEENGRLAMRIHSLEAREANRTSGLERSGNRSSYGPGNNTPQNAECLNWILFASASFGVASLEGAIFVSVKFLRLKNEARP